MTSCSLDRLAPGQALSRAFAAGDELFCAAGTLQLQTSAMAGIDALPGLQLRLHAGQSWRAPAALMLRITALDAPAHVRCTPSAAPLQAVPATDWRARARALLRSWRRLAT